MGNPYPTPQPPRRLERSRSNRVVGGVCGGLADYLNMDPNLVRLLTVLITLLTGVPAIVYLVALFLVPEEGSTGPQNHPPVQGGHSDPTYPNAQGYDVGQSVPDPAPSPQAAPRPPYASPGDRDVWGAQGAPWEQPTPPADPASGHTEPGTAPRSDEQGQQR